jgi:hypothetical protein
MKKSRDQSSPGVILPNDPLTKWMEEPETRRTLTKALIQKLKAEPPQPSTPSGSDSATAPTKFQQLMGRMAQTRQFPVDLQPINPAPQPKAPTPGPWTMEDLAEAGLPQDKETLAIAGWYSDLEKMKADLKK